MLTLGNTDSALASATQARDILGILVASNTKSTDFARELSVSNERIGDVLVMQGHLDSALAAHRDSLALRERLALENPGNDVLPEKSATRR